MSQISTEKIESKISQDIISKTQDNTPPKKERKYSTTSSDSESFISNINAEIKNFLENEENNISFSSNSEQDSPYKKSDIDYLLDSRFWKANNISSYDTEYNQEKKIFGKCLKKNAKKELNESNKQSTQENEDDELRYEHMQSSSESNNSNLHVLLNNESTENNNNEINCDKEEKNGVLDIKNNLMENTMNKTDKEIIDNIKDSNTDNNNLMSSNILMNGNNFSNNINYNNINTDSKFIFPYDQINYIPNQSGSNYYQNSYLSQNYMNFPSKYNLPSPLGSRNIITFNNDTKFGKNSSENNSPDHNSEQNVKNENINGQINKFSNSPNNDLSKKITQNQKERIDLPLILNQNNTQNMSNINYNIPKLNLNMTYYPKIQSRALQLHKQSMDKSNSTNLLPELKDINSNSTNSNTNYIYQDKLVKNNNNNIELNNNSNKNPINNYIYQNNKLKQGFNKNVLNNNIKGQKGEKQFLNLDDIACGKDIRTTIMIRNIPIKYTDEILNDTFKDFHGKYDCLYMPYDYEKNGNKGYAFINFVNPLHILLFYEKFNGKKWMHFESNKICELNMAHFQGVNEIQKHAKNFKGLKKNCISNTNENIVIPSKYLSKIKNRFPKMKYENKNKKEFVVKSFE